MGIPLRLLMVEDSEDDAVLIVRELRRGGYDVTYKRVDSASGLDAATKSAVWDMVICDFSMPHFSGTDALKLLRSQGLEIPFLFVSGTIGEDTAVGALKMGAQDYIMKDNLKRLLPAVERELREVELQKERRQMERQIQQLQRFEALGRVAGGIAHDVNNALSVILGWAQIGHDCAAAGSDMQQQFRTIIEQAKRTAGLTSQLLAFARQQVLEKRNFDLNALVTEITKSLRSVINAQIEIQLVLAPGPQVVHADATQIDQVLTNLCLNARDAMPEGGRLIIETGSFEFDEEFVRAHTYAKIGKFALLTVSDTGIGMEQTTVDKIFEPFFTTKEIGRGTGLGLSTVYGIIKQHDGFIHIHSKLGVGSAFHIYLPQ